jgi:signal transduction histidine kinase
MPAWVSDLLTKSASFMPHGHCYLWIPALLWLHVVSDIVIGVAYLGISLILYLFVRRIRLPFSPVFIAFGLFIGLCGLTHFMKVWTVWNPDYLAEGVLKAATALASIATAIGLVFVRPQVEAVVHAARLSEERRIRLESSNAELQVLLDRVREADEQKNRFFANVSHELRTPLTLILGPAEQLLAADNLDAGQRQRLRSMVGAGQSLLNQVNDLLDLAKLGAGRMELQPELRDAAPWFRQVAAQFETVAELRGIAFAVDGAGPRPIRADFGKLERVLVNLLSNAFKFTPPGGRIEARLEDDGAGGVRLSVADSGPGIAEADRETVFERFRQVEGGDTRRHGGTGLGLAIVRDFVTLHGGSVRIDTAALGGARVSAHLPRLAAPGAAPVTAPASTGNAAVAARGVLREFDAERATAAGGDRIGGADRPDVLVVEDNPELRAFIADSLGDHCNVFLAADGAEGLARAQALRPALIVTDLMMPRMSGEQLVDAVRRIPALDATPILLLSARTDDALRLRLLASGAQDYLGKPFLAEELKVRAGNLLAAKRAGDTLRASLASMSTDLQQLAAELAGNHRQLQAALAAAEAARLQAEQASRVKSGFLGLISHELRTPVSTLQMNLQLLARDPEAALPEASQPRLARLRRAARQMAALIEGLLEYTRLEAGRLESRRESLDPAAIAAQLVHDHADGAPAGVELRFEPPATPLPPLQADPGLLRVVLGNLVGNALKFTRAGKVTVRLGIDGDSHLIEVADTGSGIAAEDLERIFEPFEQLEPVHRKSLPGVGLGLALVRQIVAAIGGRIEVESAAGEGSTFRVWWPSFAVAAGGSDER